MPDDIDADQAFNERVLDMQISRAKRPLIASYADGVCANCDAETGPRKRFCDSSCSYDYGKRQAVIARQGAR